MSSDITAPEIKSSDQSVKDEVDQSVKDEVSKLFSLHDRPASRDQTISQANISRWTNAKEILAGTDGFAKYRLANMGAANQELTRLCSVHSDLPYRGINPSTAEDGTLSDADVHLASSLSQLEYPIDKFFHMAPWARDILTNKRQQGEDTTAQLAYLDHLTEHMQYLQDRASRDIATSLRRLPEMIERSIDRPSEEAVNFNSERRKALVDVVRARSVADRTKALYTAAALNDQLANTVYHSKGRIDFSKASSLLFIGGLASLPEKSLQKVFADDQEAMEDTDPSAESLYEKANAELWRSHWRSLQPADATAGTAN